MIRIYTRQSSKVLFFGIATLLLTLSSFLCARKTEASILAKTPNALGLVGYWSFEDNSGTVATDFSGRGNTGTLTNGPAWAQGKRGRGVVFDGANDYVSIANESNFDFDRTSTFSISAWVKRNSASSYDAIFAKAQGSTAYSGYQVILTPSATSPGGGNGSAVYVGQVSDNAVSNQVIVTSATSTIALNTWYHVAATFSGSGNASGISIYINGEAQSKTTFYDALSGSILNNTSPYIGVNNAVDHMFDGSIDDVRVYSRTLSAADVAALYAGGAAKVRTFENGLVAGYNFDEGGGNSVNDVTSNGNTGTLTNGATRTVGQYGRGLSLDGTNDYVTIPDASTLEGFTKMTICSWGKLTAYDAIDGSIIATKSMTAAGVDVVDPYTLWGIAVGSDHKIAFQISSGVSGSRKIFSSTGTVALNVWNHICGTYDGVTMRIYINGVVDATTLAASLTIGTNSMDMRIGGLLANLYTDVWNGVLDDVRLYNRALSAGEITNLYTQGYGLKRAVVNKSKNTVGSSALIGWWNFDGPNLTATTATESSGQGNSGTLTGASGSQNKPQPTFGKIGQALNFDGTDDYVDVGDPSNVDFGSGSYAFSAWIYPRSIATGQIIAKDASAARQFVGIGLASGNLSTVLFFTPGAIPSFVWYNTTDAPIVANQWQHVFIQRNGNSYDCYVNGVAHTMSLNVASTADLPQTMVSNTTNMTIGERLFSGAEDRFNGIIDDVRIYNRAFSAAEVLQLYNQGK